MADFSKALRPAKALIPFPSTAAQPKIAAPKLVASSTAVIKTGFSGKRFARRHD